MWKPPEVEQTWTPPEVITSGATAQAWSPPEVKEFVPPEIKKDARPRPSTWQNFNADVQDFKQGFAGLMAQAGKNIYTLGTKGPGKEYIDTTAQQASDFAAGLPEALKRQWEEIKALRHPLDAFHEHPLNQSLNALAILDVLGGGARLGIRGAGEVGRLTGRTGMETMARDVLAGAPKMLPAGKAMVPQTLSKNPIIQMAQQALLKTSEKVPGVQDALSLPGVRGLMPPGAISEEARQALLARKTLKQGNLASTAEFNRNVEDIQSKIGKLPEDERKAFVAVVEGRAMPFKMSPAMHDAMDYYRNKVLTSAQKFNLPEETAKRVAYQPLVMSKFAKYDEPLAAKIDFIGEARRGNMSAIKKVYENASRGDKPAQAMIDGWGKRVEKLRVQEAEAGITEFIGAKSAQTTQMARDLAHELTPQPLYFPHIFRDKLKISDFIRLPTRLQNYRPAFLKGRTGAGGYEALDPEFALRVHESQKQKFLTQSSLVEATKSKFAEPLAKITDLKEGYVPFMPDGAFKFYRTYLDTEGSFLKGLGMGQDMDNAFLNAVQGVMDQEVPAQRAMIGVKRAPIYQVPRPVMDILESELTSQGWPKNIHPIMKLFYDKPMEAFKYSVLGFRPGWIVNNIAGNIVTSLASRVNLARGFAMRGTEEFKQVMKPVTDELSAGGFRRSEMRFAGAARLQRGNKIEELAANVGKLLTSSEPVLESTAAETARKLLTFPIRATRGLADGIFEANSRIEDAFREAVLADRTIGMAKEAITKETARGFFDARTAWDRFWGSGKFNEENMMKKAKEFAEDPDLRADLLDRTNKVLNDYSALSSFERQVIRRVVPFWNWWKFINTFAVRLVAQDPVMADVMKNAAQIGNDIQNKEWERNGLSLEELPVWRRGTAIVGREGKKIRLLSGKSAAPTGNLGPSGLAFSPPINLLLGSMTGKKFPLDASYSHPNLVEVNGKFFEVDPQGKKVRQVERPAGPGASDALRAMVPPVGDIERALVPYRFYDSSPILGPHIPIPDAAGRPQEYPRSDRVSQILGFPVNEVEKPVLLKNKQARVQALKAFFKREVLSRRAGRKLEESSK